MLEHHWERSGQALLNFTGLILNLILLNASAMLFSTLLIFGKKRELNRNFDAGFKIWKVWCYWLGTVHTSTLVFEDHSNLISLTVLTHTDLGTLPTILLSLAPLWQVCVAESLYRMLLGLSPSCPISPCIMGGTSDMWRLLESARQVVDRGWEALQRCTNVGCLCCA